jgi:hypothetical protein
LLKLGSDLFLACKPQFISQAMVGDKSCDRVSEPWYVTHRKKKSGFAIRNYVYDPGCRSTYHRYTDGLGFQDDCWQALSVARQGQNISSCVVRNSVLRCPRKNHMAIRLQTPSSVNGKRIAIFKTSHEQQPEFRKPGS